MSLDVLYHLVETDIFIKYLDALFTTASRFVLVYAIDEDRQYAADHVIWRKFTPYITARFPCWKRTYGIRDPPPEIVGGAVAA